MSRRNRFRAFRLKLRGVRTSALIGRSGTGKSFRAHLIAEKHGFDIIIDDGLIIKDRTILCGQSSKKQLTVLAAVRRALFDDPEYSSEARQALRKARFRAALILGTSMEMVVRIADALDLPRPSEVFKIEDVASADEMGAAKRGRTRRGVHSLPLPPVTVRLGLRGVLGSRVRALAAVVASRRKRRPLPSMTVQATDIPGNGEVVFTEPAIGQMVHHCIQEFDPRISMGRLTLTTRGALHAIEIRVRIPFSRSTSGGLHDLREYIMRSLERHAGILVERVTLVVENVEDREIPPDAGRQVP
jgi:hypothetical protein